MAPTPTLIPGSLGSLTLLRTSGISGRVSVEGMGLDDVEVALTGAAVAIAMTSNGGQYAFAGLTEGTYVVSMMNPNETAYTFETMSTNVVLGDAESNITNFDGTHTRTASVSGVAYIDEAPADKMYTANEPMLPHAGIPVALQGPGVKSGQRRPGRQRQHRVREGHVDRPRRARRLG